MPVATSTLTASGDRIAVRKPWASCSNLTVRRSGYVRAETAPSAS
jgi:hypothetical protein